jgi:hypothetical protein
LAEPTVEAPGAPTQPSPGRAGVSRANLWKAAGSAAFACLGAWAALEARALGLYEFGTPGPGLFPFVFGVLLVAIALLSLAIDIFHALRPDAEVIVPERSDTRGGIRVFGYLAVGMAGSIAMNWIGFLPAALLGILLLVRVVERMPWRASLLTAVGSAVAADLLFVRLLSVPLPAVPF